MVGKRNYFNIVSKIAQHVRSGNCCKSARINVNLKLATLATLSLNVGNQKLCQINLLFEEGIYHHFTIEEWSFGGWIISEFTTLIDLGYTNPLNHYSLGW